MRASNSYASSRPMPLRLRYGSSGGEGQQGCSTCEAAGERREGCSRGGRAQDSGSGDPDVLDAGEGGEPDDGGAFNPRGRLCRGGAGGTAGAVELSRFGGGLPGKRGAHSRPHHRLLERVGVGIWGVVTRWVDSGGRARRGEAL